MIATEVTADPAESNSSLLPGLWRDSLNVTCGLTACTPGSAPGPTLSNEYGKTLPFTARLQNIAQRHCSIQHCVQFPTTADNVSLLAFAAECRAAVRRAAAVSGGRCCRSISPVHRAHSSKPAATACNGRYRWDRPTVLLHRPRSILRALSTLPGYIIDELPILIRLPISEHFINLHGCHIAEPYGAKV